ncbi:hypothetical protein BCS71_25655 [Vibrio lentus]|uniref:Uncharacterized protein n=1 Tax=Vibrio tasmaniensis TaxID=212663 RepID=A0A0H4A0N2_9VIBR|nr:hypothetical protein [Vibrio lentus]AKN39734.1 hypothetical protein [Vibrio tasmaniensis]
MMLSNLVHGLRFKIKATGETGLLIGSYSTDETRVVVMNGSPRLTNRLAKTEVERV